MTRPSVNTCSAWGIFIQLSQRFCDSFEFFINILNSNILRFNTPVVWSPVRSKYWMLVTQVVLETGLLIFVDITSKHADGSFLIIFCCVSVRVHGSFRFTSLVLGQSHLKYISKYISDSEVHGANMGPTWVLSASVGPMLAPWTLLSGITWILKKRDVLTTKRR